MNELCQSHGDFAKRLEACESKICELEKKDTDLLVRQSIIETKIDSLILMVTELKDNFKKLAEVPAKNWDAIVKAGIVAVVSGGAGILIAKVMP